MSQNADQGPRVQNRLTYWGGLLLRGVLTTAAIVIALRVFFPGGPILENGQLAPPVYLESYDGKHWDQSLFTGKPVLINFWATWCPPCLQEIPHLVKAAKIYGDQVQIIGFTVDSPAEDVFSTVKRFGINYPVAKVDFPTVERWGASTLPSSYLLDENQRIIWSMRGGLTPSDLQDAFSRLESPGNSP
jgi:thiol-disulfide isomerase/thioredoxin